jgi:dipeptidase D
MKWFEEITKIPRCSKKEEKIRAWLLDWASEHNFESKEDEAGNVVIKVPGTPGYENSPTVVLQGHMDMVCEKTPDSDHDFDNDPIELVYDGDWLKANKTTLGADNGIAIAIMQAMALSKDVEHPPFELLITVDEETGLTGANSLKPGFIEGKTLLNIDSEDEGVFTIGCAGGVDIDMDLPLELENVPSGKKLFLLKAGGFKGGHSGVDIHEQRGNAIKALFRTLDALNDDVKIQISHLKGGSAHNAIPRDAEAGLFIDSGSVDAAKKIVADIEKTIKGEFAKIDPKLFISLEPHEYDVEKVLTVDSTNKAIDFILALPHGVDSFSYVIEGLVETSNNLATINIENNELKVNSSQRSSLLSRLGALTRQLIGVIKLAGGTGHTGDGYPPWEANWDSPLLAKCKEVYKKKFGKDPVVEVIHAGLECGIIGDRNPGMDMISIGPTIKNPHSPDEMLLTTDIPKIWDFMVELMKELK